MRRIPESYTHHNLIHLLMLVCLFIFALASALSSYEVYLIVMWLVK